MPKPGRLLDLAPGRYFRCSLRSQKEVPMAVDEKKQGWKRRDFMKTVGTGSLIAAAGTAFITPRRAYAQKKTLRIIQWLHFVPDYDKWFDGVFTKAWGQKHDTDVIVDHIANTELPTRAASEAAAKQGHDLFMFLYPPSAYEQQTLDMTNVYAEVEKKHGKKIDLAHKSTFNPKSKKYFAFSDSYV